MVARVVIASSILLLSLAITHGATPIPGVGRTFGYVRDASTAIHIAVAVWEPLYGKEHIARERPYHVALSRGVWHVTGSLPQPRGRGRIAGGVAEADIRRSDGKVLHIMHGK